MQKYNFLYAGEEFIQECEELKSVIVKGKQFFYNPQAQSPIYQSIKVVREEGAFVGDYCIQSIMYFMFQASHIVYLQKVDPLFIIILILGESLLNETRAFDMDQLFDVNIFEDIQFAKCIKEHKGVVERLDLIFKVNQFNGENYYKYDIEKLFTFLDGKRMKLQEYLNTTEDFQDQVMSKDDQIRFHNSEFYLISQYLTQQISQKYNESRKILKNLELKQSSDTKYQQQHERNKDTQQDKKKVNTNKQPTKSEQQQQKDAKTSGRLDSFIKQKQENK